MTIRQGDHPAREFAGGGVAVGGDLREVKRIRDDKKKRIVASIETVGASGPITFPRRPTRSMPITGACGSIGSSPSGELRRTAAMGQTQGHHLKAASSRTPDRPPRYDPEREYLQGMIDNMHPSSSRPWPMAQDEV